MVGIFVLSGAHAIYPKSGGVYGNISTYSAFYKDIELGFPEFKWVISRGNVQHNFD